ncbi:hypothetical protein HW555_013793 [Spodoptera exigua]|uniref:Sulfatase N-terminal domain-containing protein n=1 Tax=Spodoptera exigua TaxID=7107 RepID=A0A835G274_SPOEX|nr:hypothetical protein HW555_013793 [Spodoptera exigua]
MSLIFYVLASLVVLIKCESLPKPNIVFIVADDLGWSDVSFHGSDQIMTPNIDMLAYQGIIIPQYYTDTRGTPARSALFTGKYPLRMGTQGISIASAEDRGLPTTEVLLPQYLQELGYATHLIGKWGLGKSREHYLPTNRGFDTFYGFSGSSVDYYTYNHVETWNETVFYGLDFFNNLEPVEDQRGHLTEVLTDRAVKLIRNHDTSVPLYLHMSHAAPHVGGGFVNLQTPEDLIAANDHIAHSPRRLYAGLVTGLDRSIGHVISALAERELLNNTIVVLISDNGAASTGLNRNFGSNLPLRAQKARLGKVREGNYKIIIGKVEPQQSNYYGMELKKSRIPGFLYENVLLSSDTARVFRETLFINIDLEMAATKRNYSDLYRHINNTDAERLCIPTNAKGCLFDLSVDPAESKDLWDTHPQFVQHMVLRLRAYWAAINPRQEPTLDPRANPALHDFIWLPWLDNLENVSKPLLAIPNFPLQVSVGELQYLVDFNLNAFKESLTSYVKSSADSFIQNIAKLFSF